jgi:hypothetical protein
VIGGGLPLIFLVAALTKLGEFWASAKPPRPARQVETLWPTRRIAAEKALAVALAPFRKTTG